MNDKQAMQLAIEIGRAGIAAGQTPFGSVLIKDGQAVATTHNTVWLDNDPTAHAEVNCVRQAARALGRIDLSGTTLYSTCEPCPMCLAAIHWSKVDRVVFGATIADARAAGFTELSVPARALADLGQIPLQIEAGPLREECAALFQEWEAAGLSNPY